MSPKITLLLHKYYYFEYKTKKITDLEEQQGEQDQQGQQGHGELYKHKNYYYYNNIIGYLYHLVQKYAGILYK